MILVGTWWFFASKNDTAILSINRPAAENKELVEILKKDSDSDGLQDWEETLWKTDTHNPDTDNDGTKDNDEIRSGRDPLRPFPNDELTILNKDLFTAASTSPDTITDSSLTMENIARNFAVSYFRKKLAGTEAEDIDVSLFGDMVAAEIQNVISKNVITLSDKFIATDFSTRGDSAADLKSYANALGDVIQQHFLSAEKSENVIIQEAFEQQDESRLKNLSENSDTYEKMALSMVYIPVPTELLSAHIAMANSFWRTGIALDMIANTATDPIQGFLAVEKYNEEAIKSLEPLKELIHAIKSKNIVFADSDSGAVFNEYIVKL